MSTINKTFADGEIIIKEGDLGDSFFQLLEGNAVVYLNYGLEGQVKLTELQPGQYFGEMAVIETYPRSSTVVAQGSASVIEIPGSELDSYFKENPDKIIAIMKHLGERLKIMTADYDEAKKILADMKADVGETKGNAFTAMIKKHVDFFKGIKYNMNKPSAEALRQANGKAAGAGAKNVETYNKGTIIFKAGEIGKCMYILHGGSVGIYSNFGKEGQTRLTELFPNDCFGEMGMIAEETRSATAVVEADETYVEIIRPDDLEEMFKESPVKVDMILRHLSYRLRVLTFDYFNVCKEISEFFNK
ncbi:MAG: cyclic nucleotide-binding domain-containing protein [Clostridiales bacterium]|nr:cyclic nucleotide-binding domain-containing protein [Clostridiales bacterium]